MNTTEVNRTKPAAAPIPAAVVAAQPANKKLSLLDPQLIGPAIIDSFKKLAPQTQLKNPVMFVVYVGSILSTLLLIQALLGQGEAATGFIAGVSAWLWFTVLFANFAESLAEGRSKAQAASLRNTKKNVVAKRLSGPGRKYGKSISDSASLRKGCLLYTSA